MLCDYPFDKKGRAMTVAGIYYPDDSCEILRQVKAFDLERGIGGKAQAIIAPHGAWALSGLEACAAFRSAAGRDISAVVLLGNAHVAHAEGIYLSDSDHFDTPLGSIPVNQGIIGDLSSCSTLIEINDIPHLRDYSLETLLPFIKYTFPDASIVPILMSDSSKRAKTCRCSTPPRPKKAMIPTLARAMRIIMEPIMENILFVIAANFTTYGNEAVSMMQVEECVSLLEAGDYQGFIRGIEENRFGVCSGSVLTALLSSGLLDGKTVTLVSKRPLKRVLEEDGTHTYFGGISFE